MPGTAVRESRYERRPKVVRLGWIRTKGKVFPGRVERNDRDGYFTNGGRDCMGPRCALEPGPGRRRDRGTTQTETRPRTDGESVCFWNHQKFVTKQVFYIGEAWVGPKRVSPRRLVVSVPHLPRGKIPSLRLRSRRSPFLFGNLGESFS